MRLGKIDCVYENGDAIYYRLSEKISKEEILGSFLCEKETREHVENFYSIEQHWLAVWDSSSSERFSQGDLVSFCINSTHFYKNMRHGKEKLENIRNINVKDIKRVGY